MWRTDSIHSSAGTSNFRVGPVKNRLGAQAQGSGPLALAKSRGCPPTGEMKQVRSVMPALHAGRTACVATRRNGRHASTHRRPSVLLEWPPLHVAVVVTAVRGAQTGRSTCSVRNLIAPKGVVVPDLVQKGSFPKKFADEATQGRNDADGEVTL